MQSISKRAMATTPNAMLTAITAYWLADNVTLLRRHSNASANDTPAAESALQLRRRAGALSNLADTASAQQVDDRYDPAGVHQRQGSCPRCLRAPNVPARPLSEID